MSPLLRELRNRYGLALDRRTAQAARDAPDTASALQRVLVSETSFFRHAAQLDALMQVALPERMAARDLLQGYLLGMPAAPEQAEPALNVAWGP